MARPTFIYVGPGRAATSWLKEMLESHPEVGLSRVKETEFFNNNYEKGTSWYEGMFPSGEYAALGEISTMYYVDKSVPARIKENYPSVKILYGARNPKELLESFYQFGVRRGVAADTITKSLDEPNAIYMGSGYKDRQSSDTNSSGDQVSMLDSVRLARYLQGFISEFGAENVHVVSFDEIATSPEVAIENLYQFIGVNEKHRPAGLTEKVNPSLAPKSKVVALLAHKMAYFLRKLGLNNLLTRLHESRFIKQLLFKKPSKIPLEERLPDSIVLELESEAEKLAVSLKSLKMA